MRSPLSALRFPTRIQATFLLTGAIILSPLALQAEEAPPKASENPLNVALKALFSPGSTPASPPEEALPATHEQVNLIKLKEKNGQNTTIHALALDKDGRLLAACGGTRVSRQESIDGPAVTTITQPGEIRVFDAEGKQVDSWSVQMAPQAIFVASDGAIFVAGYETVLQLSPSGELMHEARLPHVADMEENTETIRKSLTEQIKQQSASMQGYLDQQKDRLAELKKKPENERSALDKSQIQAAQQMVDAYSQYVATDEKTINERVLASLNSKKSVASLAATKDNVFVATSDTAGHGFCIWRMSRDFKDSKKIVTGLSGCCGNMHIGAGNGEIYVAENSRHRVCRYDEEGELITTFGKRDREGEEGFSSCCNPMNVFITGDGEVYTSESNVGRVKRFTSTGEYQELIGDVSLVPGCKNVSIVVTPDHDRVYMMDMTRSHIIVMKRKAADSVTAVE
ncbi:hypothetical protein [uncultured Rubinisphaera sp.]|uniref:hypothetical protein n=1 Tax=uncultured Rubinisphaera sp. TaxID=1678686 RepID=UPI0030D8FDC9